MNHTRTLAACMLAAITSHAFAQDSFQSIRDRLAAKREAAAAKNDGMLGYEDHLELQRWYAGALKSYVAAAGGRDDRPAARVELARTWTGLRERDAAIATLKELDADHAGMNDLLDAAELALTLGLDAESATWTDKGLAAAKTFEERMHAGMVLMTRLVQPERAIRWFETEQENAKGDEAKAEVLWWHAVAVREREDRQDGDYEKVLERLAAEFPKTRFGRIARDRLRAMKLEPGDPAVELAGEDLDGAALTLSSLRGKVVAVYFWASWSERSLRGIEVLESFVKKYPSDDFAVFGVCLDEDPAELKRYRASRDPHPWRDLYDGRGFDGDHARRAFVEAVPDLLVVGRNGEVAEMRVYLDTPDNVRHATEVIDGAIASK